MALRNRQIELAVELQPQTALPGKALVAAVLERALEDLQLGAALTDGARQWLEERAPGRAWSFDWCCAMLDLDPDAVRQRLVGDLRGTRWHARG